MVVGYHVSDSLAHDGAVIALKNALQVSKKPKGVIFHSDRGIQYCCHNFLDEITKAGLISSMTDADHCAQNALAECMNGLLKSEFLLDLEHASVAAAERAVDDAIQIYNSLRPHGSLDDRTPAEVHFGKDRSLHLWLSELAILCPFPKFPCVNPI